jgi:hypothetical protein
MKEDEVGGVCNTKGRDEICIESFNWKLLEEETA